LEERNIQLMFLDDTDLCYTCIATPQEDMMLAIRLPPEIETRLEKLAAATGRTKTFYAREAILEHLTDLEDIYLAEQRVADIKAGRTQTIPLEDIMKSYDLAD
jgi:RHH-type rel operon transcriptional repressor/antitoxin RelB